MTQLRYKTLGRLDMLAWFNGVPEGLYHYQTKVMSPFESIPSLVAKISASMHERAYSYSCEDAGIPIKGTVLNVLRKQVTGPVNKKTGERKIEDGWAPFERHRISIGKRDREQFAHDSMWVVQQIERCMNEGRWPRFTQNCVRHNRVCGFYDHCKLGVPVNEEKFTKREKDYVDKENSKISLATANQTPPWSVIPDVGPPPVFNISRLQDFVTCPTLYKLKWVDNWKHDDEDDAPALVFGSACHEALRAWYGNASEDTVFDAKTGLHGWQPCFDNAKALAAYHAYIGQFPEHDQKAKETEKVGYGELLLRRYFEKYRDHDGEQIRLVIGVEIEAESLGTVNV